MGTGEGNGSIMAGWKKNMHDESCAVELLYHRRKTCRMEVMLMSGNKDSWNIVWGVEGTLLEERGVGGGGIPPNLPRKPSLPKISGAQSRRVDSWDESCSLQQSPDSCKSSYRSSL